LKGPWFQSPRELVRIAEWMAIIKADPSEGGKKARIKRKK
jgi:hypothetical protein